VTRCTVNIMQNPLQGLCVHDMGEVLEGQAIFKTFADYRFCVKKSYRAVIKHEGNMRRLLRGGFRIYRPKNSDEHYLVAMPDYVLSNPDAFTPVLLDKDQVIGM